MIQICLNNDGAKKVYKATGVCMGVSLDAYNLYREYTEAEGNYSDDLIQRLNELICRCFGDQFSENELLKGYPESAFVLYPRILREIVGYVHDKLVNFPEPAMAPEGTKKMRS